MTREEARKKAEEWADEEANYRRSFDDANAEVEARVLNAGILKGYMKCFDDLTSGEPDGWECTLVNSRGEFNKFITFDSEEARIQGGGGWRIVPVKIVELEKK